MQLLHRHFDMSGTQVHFPNSIVVLHHLARLCFLSDDEVLVDTNGTSIPWQQVNLEEPAGIIEPTSWKLTSPSGVLCPFEYAFKPEGTPSKLSLPTSFIEQLYSILLSSNLSEVLGLGLVPKDIGLVETTKGRANITWASTNHGFPLTTPTMWAISTQGAEPVMGCVKVCGYQTKNNAQHSGAVRHDK